MAANTKNPGVQAGVSLDWLWSKVSSFPYHRALAGANLWLPILPVALDRAESGFGLFWGGLR